MTVGKAFSVMFGLEDIGATEEKGEVKKEEVEDGDWDGEVAAVKGKLDGEYEGDNGDDEEGEEDVNDADADDDVAQGGEFALDCTPHVFDILEVGDEAIQEVEKAEEVHDKEEASASDDTVGLLNHNDL